MGGGGGRRWLVLHAVHPLVSSLDFFRRVQQIFACNFRGFKRRSAEPPAMLPSLLFHRAGLIM